ncbi:MAG: response regulator transcription factor [Flavobacteriales bacterium]|nr:response regulator transcription factor [Flavobacteriales bacterium]
MSNKDRLRLRIVEDDELIRETLRSIFLATSDMHVLAAHGSVEEALAEVEAEEPEVMLMDINLPGMSGIEGVRELSQRWPSTQFLMYTVNDTDDKVFEALKAGANGYLLKNSSPSEIVQGVRDIQKGGSPMSMSVARRVVRHFRPTLRDGDGQEVTLTPREQSILDLLAQGLLYKEIAANLDISEGTIKQYVHRIYSKLHVVNRTEAVNRYYGR